MMYNQKNEIVVLTIALLITIANCTIGSQPMLRTLVSSSTFSCIKNSGFQFVAVEATLTSGEINPYANQNLINAKSAGLNTDIVVNLCRSKDATETIDAVVNSMDPKLYDRVYLKIYENFYPGCGWTGDNCAYVMGAAERVKASGKQPEIQSIYFYWSSIMKGQYGCPQLATISPNLWYTDTKNEQAALTNYTPFGGWSRPSRKTYVKNVASCGLAMDKVFNA